MTASTDGGSRLAATVLAALAGAAIVTKRKRTDD